MPFPKVSARFKYENKTPEMSERPDVHGEAECFMHQSDSLKKLTSLYLSVQKLFLTIPVCYLILPLPTSSLIFLDSHIYSNSKNVNLNVSVWPACSPGWVERCLMPAIKPLIAVSIQLMCFFTAPAASSHNHHLKTQLGNPTFQNSYPASKRILNVLATGITDTRKYDSGQFGWPVC